MKYTLTIGKEEILKEISAKINFKKEERKYWQNMFDNKKAFYDEIVSNGCTHDKTKKQLDEISNYINAIDEELDKLNEKFNELSNSEDEIELKISR